MRLTTNHDVDTNGEGLDNHNTIELDSENTYIGDVEITDTIEEEMITREEVRDTEAEKGTRKLPMFRRMANEHINPLQP